MQNKTIRIITLAVLTGITLSGCTDAVAKLNESNTVLFTVGKQNVTKGEVFSIMKASGGATLAVNNANKEIAKAEIEVTDEMKESAQSTLDSYKSMYGDSFTSYLEKNNMTEDEYLNDYLIPSLQAEQLTTRYIEENFDSLCDSYTPIKATVLEFSSQDDANAALSELKDGTKTAAEAAKDHNSTSTGNSVVYTMDSSSLDSMVRTVLTSSSPDDGWQMIPKSDASAFEVIHVDSNTPSEFKDEAITALSNISNISNDSTTYFFKKYNFHIYDKVIYDNVKSDNPDALVQDMTDDDSTSSN